MRFRRLGTSCLPEILHKGAVETTQKSVQRYDEGIVHLSGGKLPEAQSTSVMRSVAMESIT